MIYFLSTQKEISCQRISKLCLLRTLKIVIVTGTLYVEDLRGGSVIILVAFIRDVTMYGFTNG